MRETKRGDREQRIALGLRGPNREVTDVTRWTRHVELIDDGILTYRDRTGLDYVRDGKPCKWHADHGHNVPWDPACEACENCFLPGGRGTSLVDVAREITANGIRRVDFLGIKTAGIESNGKIPSYVTLTGGMKPETLDLWLDAAQRGNALPILCYAEDYGKVGTGLAICIDASEVVRACGAPVAPLPVGESYAKGKAPTFYQKWGSKVKSGEGRLSRLLAKGASIDLTPTEIDGVIHGPGWKMYPETRINLSALGIKRANWTRIHVSEIRTLVDDPVLGFNWDLVSV